MHITPASVLEAYWMEGCESDSEMEGAVDDVLHRHLMNRNQILHPDYLEDPDRDEEIDEFFPESGMRVQVPSTNSGNSERSHVDHME